MKTDLIKGFRDFTEEEAEKRTEIRKILIEIFEKYCFEPAETPIIEYEEFVKGGNQQDEVISDIFRLKDKGKRNLALRYEFTFQLKRLAKNKKLPFKRYQIGEVFRDEPVSANRLRQFTQCDVDIVGSTIKEEAEILAVAKEIFDKLGIKIIIYVNNRKLLNEILDDKGIKEKNKEQVLREFDKVDKLSKKQIKTNLNKLGAKKIWGILEQNLEFFRKYKSFSEIEDLITYCELYGIKVSFSPFLARGLSYYNGTVFEVKVQGTKESIAGGGSYKIDGTQATGISFGLDRIFNLAKIKLEKERYLIWPNEKDKQAISMAKKLRNQGKTCSLIYKTNMKKIFDYANSKKFSKVIFYDKKTNKFKIKDMGSGKESVLRL